MTRLINDNCSGRPRSSIRAMPEGVSIRVMCHENPRQRPIFGPFLYAL